MTLQRINQLEKLLRRLRQIDADTTQRTRLIEKIKNRLYGNRVFESPALLSWANTMWL